MSSISLPISLMIEIFILLSTIVVLFLIGKKYTKKKTELSKILFWIFLLIALAQFFLVLSRLTYYPLNVEQMDPNSIIGWIMLRIGFYRPAFISVIIAGYLNYIFKEKVFQDQKSKSMKKFLAIFGAIIIIFQIIFFDLEFPIYDVIAFLLVFIYFNLVMIPFMSSSYKLYKRLDEGKYKNAILSLVIMALCFILIFLFFLLDRINVYLTENLYSIFYYLGELSMFIGILSGYLGFIKPGE